MTKPTIKHEVAVKDVLPGLKIIYFYATNDAVTEFMEYGLVEPTNTHHDLYRIDVDSRFDFDEVLEYIQNYG